MTTPIERARAYLRALEQDAPEHELRTFFADDVIQEEFPNRLVPAGAERDLAGLLAASARGRAVVEGQRFDVRSELQSGDRVALEIVWTARLRVPVGTLRAGDTMRARFAVFLDFVDGKIRRQRNYDCFDAF